LYAAPSVRTGVAFAVLGSSVVLCHPVGSLYTVLLLASVSVLFLPYLLLCERRLGVTLLLSLGLLGGFSVLYAWDTYDLGRLLAGLLSGSEGGAGGAAVSQAVGTQPPLKLSHLPDTVSHPVLWLGLIGVFMLLAGRSGRGLPGTLVRITLLLWAGILFAGSRTAQSGFPQRFERDLSIPLALLAALALITAVRALLARNPSGWARPVVLGAGAGRSGYGDAGGRGAGHREPAGSGKAHGSTDAHATACGGGRVAADTQRRRQHRLASVHRGHPRAGGAGDGRLHRASDV
jgi:hypothetical protein